MTKKIKYLLFIIICNIFMINVYAAGASITAKASSSKVQVGDTVKVTVTVSTPSNISLGSWQFNVAYDTSVLTYVSSTLENGLTSAGYMTSSNQHNKTYTITFKAKKAGTGKVTINNAETYNFDTDASIATSTSNATITIVNPSSTSNKSNSNSNSSSNSSKNSNSNSNTTKSANNDLASLSISGYEINPKFNKNTTSYSVSVPNEIREIDVNATVADSKAKLNGTGNIKLSEGSNKVNIIVTAENGNTKTYTVNVNVEDKDPIIVTVDGEKYTVVQKKDGLEIPNNYKDTTITINGTDVPAFTNDITNFTLVGLTDTSGNMKLYIYSDDNYILYNEYRFNGISIYIKEPSDEVKFAKLKEIKITIDDNEVKAYKIDDNNYPLVYGVNLETGEENWYTYEESEKTLQKFLTGSKNSTEDVKIITTDSISEASDKFKNLSIILGVVSSILIIFLVIAGMKLSTQNKTEN